MSIITSKKIKTKKIVGVVVPPTYTLATLPDPGDYIGGIVKCSNGGGAGVATLAISDGTSWKAITIGTALAAS